MHAVGLFRRVMTRSTRRRKEEQKAIILRDTGVKSIGYLPLYIYRRIIRHFQVLTEMWAGMHSYDSQVTRKHVIWTYI